MRELDPTSSMDPNQALREILIQNMRMQDHLARLAKFMSELDWDDRMKLKELPQDLTLLLLELEDVYGKEAGQA